MMDENVELAARLAELVDYKAGGSNLVFAQELGWSKQYLNKLLNGEALGLQPLRAILARYADVDARWLILGEGHMLNLGGTLVKLLEIERYMPTMTAAERERIMEGGTWTREDLERWSQRLELTHVRARMRAQELQAKKRRNLQNMCKPESVLS